MATAEHHAFLKSLQGHPEPVVSALWRVRKASSPLELLDAERAVHDALRAQADELVGAAILARVRDDAFVQQARIELQALSREHGVALNSRGWRPTTVHLMGGRVVKLETLLLTPATPREPALRRARGSRGPSGSGVYPALAKLGISERATPALREAVAHQVAASSSIDAARVALARQGVQVDHKAALRYAYAFAKTAIDARDHAFAAQVAIPPSIDGIAGRNLVVSLDGGRVRLKEVDAARAPGDRTFEANWREPKILTIYVLDERGRRDPKVKAVIDGTLGNANQVAALLVGHLRLLGSQHAAQVRFIADGGSWIWTRTESIRKGAGISADRWVEQLDLFHAVEYLGRLIQPLGPEEIDRRAWLAEAKANLLHADVDEVLTAIRALPKDRELKIAAAEDYLTGHRTCLMLVFCRSDGQPLGSGGVESAVRRVINLRLKGNGVFWLREHAEFIIHLRGHVVTGRWRELVERTLVHPTWKPNQIAA